MLGRARSGGVARVRACGVAAVSDAHVRVGGLERTCGLASPAELDYVIISYVLIYVARERGHPRHEAVCDGLARLLASGVRAIIISERPEENAACGMMEARGVPVERLIEQSLGKDERQTVFLSAGAHPLPKARPSPKDSPHNFPTLSVGGGGVASPREEDPRIVEAKLRMTGTYFFLCKNKFNCKN